MKRKIAFISHESPLATLGGVDAGGQVIYIGQIAKKLSRLGYEVDIFTRWDDARLPQVVEWDNGVRVIQVKAGPITFINKEKLFPHMKEFTDNMIDFMKTEKDPYRLIHANFWLAVIPAMEIKQRFNIPFVVTFHALGKIRRIFQGKDDKFPDNRFGIEEKAMREAAAIIAECPQDREDMINYYNANPDKITIIPAGFDPNEFYPIDKLLCRMVLDLNPKEPIILQLGRVIKRKGIDNVIAVLPILRRKFRVKAKLLIVGGDSDVPNARLTPEIRRLRRIARQEKVEDCVRFVGRRGRETLKYFYNAADVFTTTPWYEPFGITPLEAMACGTPVVGSNVGGIKYTVLDGKTGYLVPPNDAESLAQKLADIFKNRKIANFFKENGLKRVNNAFTWEKIASSISQVYEKVLFGDIQIPEKEKQLHIIESGFRALSQTVEQSQFALRIPMLDAAQAIARSFQEGGKVLVCGNGGSAADSQHLAAELVGRFQISLRQGLPVISLTSDTSFLTAWGNDFSFDEIFSRQVNALGQANDILIGISTSGNSENVNLAFIEAHKKGMVCIGLLGKKGGEAAELCDVALIVPSDDTQRIQEIHTNVIHTICELIEKQLFTSEDRPETVLPKSLPVKPKLPYVLKEQMK
ncbi:MAG: glycosyltransferase [Patescibacteria group bacterium]|nr:glycosyltransferase [Patescibacteria group bacterium]